MLNTVPVPGNTCTPGTLKRLALERLQKRLEDDQMTTAELLKVAALPDTDAPEARPPGEWTIQLGEPSG